jgi:hypothetical protein
MSVIIQKNVGALYILSITTACYYYHPPSALDEAVTYYKRLVIEYVIMSLNQ